MHQLRVNFFFILALSLFIVSMMTPLSAGAAGNPTIEIINYSKIPTASVEKWTKAGAAKLSDWQADT